MYFSIIFSGDIVSSGKNIQSANYVFLLSQKEIAQLTCECERHIGTQSGGMDQVTLHTNLITFLCTLHFGFKTAVS